jgi:hypothetical protein
MAFASQGPYSLEELQVMPGSYEAFSSYNDFVKGATTGVIGKRFGGAGQGYQYHHIVTQGGDANEDNIPPEQLQNTDNIIVLPTLLHEIVNAEYLQPKERTNMSLYQWVQTQSYEEQREEGFKILRELHILK